MLTVLSKPIQRFVNDSCYLQQCNIRLLTRIVVSPMIGFRPSSCLDNISSIDFPHKLKLKKHDRVSYTLYNAGYRVIKEDCKL